VARRGIGGVLVGSGDTDEARPVDAAHRSAVRRRAVLLSVAAPAATVVVLTLGGLLAGVECEAAVALVDCPAPQPARVAVVVSARMQ
jgi:hypothetical protein